MFINISFNSHNDLHRTRKLKLPKVIYLERGIRKNYRRFIWLERLSYYLLDSSIVLFMYWQHFCRFYLFLTSNIVLWDNKQSSERVAGAKHISEVDKIHSQSGISNNKYFMHFVTNFKCRKCPVFWTVIFIFISLKNAQGLGQCRNAF